MPRLLWAMILGGSCAATSATAQDPAGPAQHCPQPDRPVVLHHWHSELPAVGLGEVATPQTVTLRVPAHCPGSRIELQIEWDNPADDLDLDLLDPDGQLAARADRLNPLEGDAVERLSVRIAEAGAYRVSVRNFAPQVTAYRGRAVWSCPHADGCKPADASGQVTPPRLQLRDGQILTIN